MAIWPDDCGNVLAFLFTVDPAERRWVSQALNPSYGLSRRYWEHTIRDDNDFARHVDYIHINPVKHRLVTRVSNWPYSSFHRMVKLGVYPGDWAS